MQICHLIFTRFNIQYDAGDTIGIQPEWLDERLRLFEQYCVPSMQRQTCTDYVWILTGDIRTSDEYKAKIEHFCLQVPQLRVYWLPFAQDAYHSFYRQTGREFAKGKEVLVSTRLDSDDAFPENYVETIQKMARGGIEGVVSFPVGRQTFVRDHKSYRIRYVQNHSTSRIERSGFETIMVFDHTQLTGQAICVVETEQPMWEEIVHGGNIINDYMPQYKYYITGFSDVWDLSRRWVRFQTRRLTGFMKRHLVFADKR